MEYLVVLGVMREFRLESHPASRLPTGRCLKCGRKLRRTGYRPQLYCDEKCRSAFRRARVAFVERLKRSVAESVQLALAA